MLRALPLCKSSQRSASLWNSEARVESVIKTIEILPDCVRLLDQRKLPTVEEYVDCQTYQEVAAAIQNMVVRGAPAIGVTAAAGIALGMQQVQPANAATLAEAFERICTTMAQTRPTAVNLFWAIDCMRACVDDTSRGSPATLATGVMGGSPTLAARRHGDQSTHWRQRFVVCTDGQYGPDALQRRRFSDRWLWHSAWRHPRGPLCWPPGCMCWLMKRVHFYKGPD